MVKMKTLVKFNKKRTICGFTVCAGWFGEFSARGELVKVYAYPDVHYNNFTQFAYWNTCRVFYKVGCEFVGDWDSWHDVPADVCEHFGNIAEYQERCYIEDYYNTVAN